MPGPLPISPDTAIKLSKYLGVPIEHLMHMPRHILLQKLAEMAAREQTLHSSKNPVREQVDEAVEADGGRSAEQPDKPRQSDAPEKPDNSGQSDKPGKDDPS